MVLPLLSRGRKRQDYEDNKFVAKADNLTIGELLDMWAEEELKTGTLRCQYHYECLCSLH